MHRVACASLTLLWMLGCLPLIAADRAAVTRSIDAQIESALKAEGIAPARRADDAELLRRIYLDLLGRIPTVAEAEAFLNATAKDKAHRLIDALLEHEEMPVHFSRVLDEWLNGNLREREFGRQEFLTYLVHALQENRGWDKMARDLLLPQAEDEIQRGAAYFLASRLRGGDKQEKIDGMTTAVASVFFGVQLQCAKCHDHPYVDDWQQDHYYGLAAFLGRMQEAKYKNAPFMRERADGEVTFITTDQTEKTARLLFLDGHVVEEPQLPENRNEWYAKLGGDLPEVPRFSRREALADYALNADTPYFRRAMVNRIWKHLMGRGLVEPVDQIHDANPASHPELLALLGEDFAESGFDLKRIMAAILHSDAYLRSSRWTREGEPPGGITYALAHLKPLSPDQVALSIGIATGHYDTLRAKFEREKNNRKLTDVTPAVTRALYASERDVQELAARFQNRGEEFEANAAQALFLAYSPLLQKQLQPRSGNLVERLAKQSDEQAASNAVLAVLSRPVEAVELNRIVDFLASGEASRSQLCQELVWALLCSGEFRFNH